MANTFEKYTGDPLSGSIGPMAGSANASASPELMQQMLARLGGMNGQGAPTPTGVGGTGMDASGNVPISGGMGFGGMTGGFASPVAQGGIGAVPAASTDATGGISPVLADGSGGATGGWSAVPPPGVGGQGTAVPAVTGVAAPQAGIAGVGTSQTGLFPGTDQGVMQQNIQTLRARGVPEAQAVQQAMQHAQRRQ